MIKQQAIKGVKWSLITVVAGNLLQFIQLAVVSRYISAADYGIMSITLVIIYFAQLLGDMGISNALIYKQKISQAAFSGLFWLSLLFCWLIFGILFFLSPSLADFFRQPALKEVIRVTAVIFTFLPLQLLYLSILRIEFQFNKIAFTELFSKLVALVLAVIFAMNGKGVFALVYATLAGVAVSALLYFYFGSRKMRIAFVCRLSALRGYLHFGGFQTGNDILNYFNFNIDTFLLGRLLGVDAAGFYAFAKNLAIKPAQIINPVITQVAFPVMAKVNTNKALIKSIYLRILSYVATLNFIIYPFLAASAVNIIRFFFSDRWLPAAPVLQALSLYCMIRSVFNPVGALMSARGMVQRSFYWNVIMFLIIPAAVYFSFKAGILWVSVSLLIAMVLFLVPMWKFLVLPASGAGLYECWACIGIPLFNAACVYAALFLYHLLPIENIRLQFAGSVLVWLTVGFWLTRFINKKVYHEVRELMLHPASDAEQLSGG